MTLLYVLPEFDTREELKDFLEEMLGDIATFQVGRYPEQGVLVTTDNWENLYQRMEAIMGSNDLPGTYETKAAKMHRESLLGEQRGLFPSTEALVKRELQLS